VTTYDQLILYGRENALRNLEKRKQDFAGDQEHEKAVQEQNREKEKQKKEDKRSEK
jgi:hypothetical protein